MPRQCSSRILRQRAADKAALENEEIQATPEEHTDDVSAEADTSTAENTGEPGTATDGTDSVDTGDQDTEQDSATDSPEGSE